MKNKLFKSVLIAVLVIQTVFIPVGIVSAETYYEGTGPSRSACTLRRTYSGSELIRIGDQWAKSASGLQGAALISALTPKLGKALSSIAGWASLYAGHNATTFKNAGRDGKKVKEYYCEKVKWDGYSQRSYINYKITN